MSEPLDLSAAGKAWMNAKTPDGYEAFTEEYGAELIAEVVRLRAALHGSEAGPQEAREELQRLANIGATDTVSRFLADAVTWAQCDLSEHGEGPCGGFKGRLEKAREAHEAWLNRSEAGVSALVLDTSWLDDEPFDAVMYRYRMAPMTNQAEVCAAFEAVIAFVRAALGVSPAAPEKDASGVSS